MNRHTFHAHPRRSTARWKLLQVNFWAAAELAAHKKHAPRFEITFGFEARSAAGLATLRDECGDAACRPLSSQAVAHALFACDAVTLYGFFLDHGDAAKRTDAKGKAAMGTPYHYYENKTYDKAAKVRTLRVLLALWVPPREAC